MNILSSMLTNPPELSEESAVQLLEFLRELTAVIELQYADQLRRYYPPQEPPEPMLFDDFEDDDGPPF